MSNMINGSVMGMADDDTWSTWEWYLNQGMVQIAKLHVMHISGEN